MIGNNILISLKGNHISGNGSVEVREILLDLRLKVYYKKAIIIKDVCKYVFF